MTLNNSGAAIVLAITLAATGASLPAHAGTITFGTGPVVTDFTGPVTENGFTYSTASGHLYLNDLGNPADDMEGQIENGGGVLDIVRASSGDFTFNSLDFSAYNGGGQGSQTLTVTGYLGASAVGTDTFSLSNTNNFSPTFANWTLESASGLAGVKIDDLKITLNAGTASDSQFSENIDNVNLSPTGVPEPATWAMMLMGFVGLGGVMRSRRRLAPAAA